MTSTMNDIIYRCFPQLKEYMQELLQENSIQFASDKESWAELKLQIEAAKTAISKINDLHKDLWTAVKEQNDTAFSVTAHELGKTAEELTARYFSLAVTAETASLE